MGEWTRETTKPAQSGVGFFLLIRHELGLPDGKRGRKKFQVLLRIGTLATKC